MHDVDDVFPSCSCYLCQVTTHIYSHIGYYQTNKRTEAGISHAHAFTCVHALK